MVLDQVKTGEHSNEITAIPALLDLLKVKGCIVTIDAEGCRADFAEPWLKKYHDLDKRPGRVEIRECYHSDEIAALPRMKTFTGAKSIAIVRGPRGSHSLERGEWTPLDSEGEHHET